MTNKYIIPGIIAVVLIGGFVYFMSANKTGKDATMDNTGMTKEEAEKMMRNDKTMEGKTISAGIAPSINSGSPTPPSSKIDEPKPIQPAPPPVPQSGSYKDYSAATVEAEQKAGNKVVLYFHASWCPFCKVANQAFMDRANEIPAGVTVLKTDYDSNTELKKKYGVTYQHTFVQIDSEENLVTKWNGGDIDALKKNLK